MWPLPFQVVLAATAGALLPPSQQDTLPPTGSLSGIIAAREGRGINRAVIVVLPGNDSAITAADGTFSFQGLDSGLHVLQIRALGFEPRYVPVTLGEASGWRGRLVLEDLPQELPEIRVETRFGKPERYAHTTRYDDYFRRKRIGFGTFIDRDQIERRQASHFLQLLDGIPGVTPRWSPPGSPSPATIRFSGCRGSPPAVVFYVNGVRVYASGGESGGRGLATLFGGRGGGSSDAARAFADFLATLNPSEIELIEVYKRPSEIPGDLARENNCAVIVIWTK